MQLPDVDNVLRSWQDGHWSGGNKSRFLSRVTACRRLNCACDAWRPGSQRLLMLGCACHSCSYLPTFRALCCAVVLFLQGSTARRRSAKPSPALHFLPAAHARCAVQGGSAEVAISHTLRLARDLAEDGRGEQDEAGEPA